MSVLLNKAELRELFTDGKKPIGDHFASWINSMATVGTNNPSTNEDVNTFLNEQQFEQPVTFNEAVTIAGLTGNSISNVDITNASIVNLAGGNADFTNLTVDSFTTTSGDITLDNITLTQNLDVGGVTTSSLQGNVTGDLKGDIKSGDGSLVLDSGSIPKDAWFKGDIKAIDTDVTILRTKKLNDEAWFRGDIRANNDSVILENGTDGTDAVFTGDIQIHENITHVGDTNTQIKFPANDTISFQTNGTDRIKIHPDGKIGIGSTANTPLSAVHIGEETLIDRVFVYHDSTNTAFANFGTIALKNLRNPFISFHQDNGDRLCYIQARTETPNENGVIYMNERAGSHIFRSTGQSSDNFLIDSAGNVTARGDVTAFSDERLKENITPIENCLEKIKQINGVKYIRKDLKDNKQHIGLIAQNVETVLPELVSLTENSEYKTVNYQNMVAVLIEAIKEQQLQIEQLQAKIK